MIHTSNFLLAMAKRSSFGWIKELCYQTLLYGELDDTKINEIFNLFNSSANAVTPEPVPDTLKKLELLSLEHVEGVNALKHSEKIEFCESGITLLYGQNATGKSGYFRVLEHLSGSELSNPVLPNIYDEHSAMPRCKIRYTLEAVRQPEYEWTNKDADRGVLPFNRITVFNSRYANYLIKQHGPREYMLDLYSYTSCNVFLRNYLKLKTVVSEKCPDKVAELTNDEISGLNLEMIYETYISALNIRMIEKLKNLLGDDRGISIEKIHVAGRPELFVKLSHPYRVEEILSEGEQKALALALLLADNELRNVKDPIIFDDPVNSLDNKIIRKFVKELMQLENQLIIFSHNYWFANLFITSSKCKKCVSNVPLANRDSNSTAKYIIPYELICIGANKGIVTSYKDKKAQLYLDAAKQALLTVPFETEKAPQIMIDLRLAIEHLIDEKVFLNLHPCKFRGSGSFIPWPELAKLKDVPSATVITLQEQYTILSDGGSHYGTGAVEDALDYNELKDVYDKLVALL